MKNLFYFSYLNSIGGIEQFFAYLTEKYQDWDITIVYQTGDKQQIKRLQKYVKLIKFAGQQFECDKAFFCFNIDIKPFVKAKETALLLHGDYKAMVEQGQLSRDCYIFTEPFDKYYGVSQVVCDSWKELTGYDCEVLYNPFIQQPTKRILKLVYCGRLTQEKGGDLVQKLISRLDELGIDYLLYVYSNQSKFSGNNVIFMGTRLDAGQLLCKDNFDYLLITSKNEGYCYSLVQALSNGLPVVATPCPVFKEIGVNKTNSITIDFDGSNINEVIDRMLRSQLNFKYTPKNDNWNKVLVPGKSTYSVKRVKIQALRNYYDTEEEENIKLGDIYEVSEERAKVICDVGYATRFKEDKNGKSSEM